MCNLCSINHFVDDELDDEYDEPSLCVHGANHQHQAGTEQADLSAQAFYPVSQGSSF